MSTEEPIRDDLAELLRRRLLTEDAARPTALEKRHGRGGRSARENVADLIDAGSWVEYGRYAVAAQRGRREAGDLIANTPADGLVAGTATVGGRPTAVLAYDYTVLAGTQGVFGHLKKDRMFELIERMRLPVVFFAEGGGGRPGDSDHPVVSSLQVRAFALWAKLSGTVPRIAIVNGSCFAGNAVIAGCADLIIATESASIGMGGPAMIAGGGLGSFAPEEVGPVAMQAPNGVIDLLVADEAAAVAATRTLLSYFESGPRSDWTAPDQRPLRDALPESGRRAYDVIPLIERLADAGSTTVLRERFAPELVTALARIEGRPLGVIANNTKHMAGTVTAEASDKAARFLQLCDAFGLPLLSLIDTPGYMVGPRHEAGALVRRASRLLVAGAALTVPTIAVVLRRAFGLGAQAMAFGSLHEPLLTVAWPGATLGPMGLEGAVRLALRRELEAIADDDEREARVRALTAQLHEHAQALNAAQLFELDDVVDPAETRALIARTLAAAGPPRASGRTVDTW
ncbi:carboxyl transferase domain-containing protein [Conexibacter sp. JD483]|uniref:acyl-CoA carboxylase subunit beta n=1 Tax=unclassified Conexibacter TaxID=2627773 RepID=UPI00271E3C7E|nr:MULTISPECIES: carboxyl transferase domain-containing protein [unclassified Conexibacter]MDO8187778.1 carboxyl transferase domain-containing protein [Conexibacter sp. CPCC 205706]MDO8201387.1 carboxyl transferase domain-containing protein [Conexibacter sp. CPCC 205762]MDR9372711.1 carboxyl transferase domain-containing protein [Conexibacter sp. JD483]